MATTTTKNNAYNNEKWQQLTISDGNGSNHHQKHSIAGDDIAYNNEKCKSNLWQSQ